MTPDTLERQKIRSFPHPGHGPPDLGDGGGGSEPPAVPPGPAQPDPDASPGDDWGMRCGLCSLDWPLIPRMFGYPDAERFMAQVMESCKDPANSKLLCPCCEQPIYGANNLNPMGAEEAWSKKNHADFDRFYEQRGEREPLPRAELEKYVNP